jgi:hypothetical protein
MTFVVPTASSQTVISAEAAYFVFGFGQTGQVTPWDDESQYFVRNQNSGTQTMLGMAIHVPANRWKGIDSGSSGGVLTKLTGATNPEKAIGILATDLADDNRATLKVLAYQHYGQLTGYWPDSKATSFDKMNVRDGHYPIWGPMHFLAKIDATTKLPAKKEASDLVSYFKGTVTPPPVPLGNGTTGTLLDLEIAKHDVPQCAMKVQRTSEMGDVSAYTPTEPCGCYFDKKTSGATTCTTCTTDTDCGGGGKKCRYGYCEAR